MRFTEKTKLLEQLKGGSHKAFELLYEQHFDLLYGFVFKLTRSHSLSCEIVQNTFIKVWLNHKNINTELSFKAWLYKIAKNQMLDQLKKQLSQPLFDDYLNYSQAEGLSVDSTNNKFDFDAFCISLQKAKTKLSPRQKQVFELLKEQSYSVSEVVAQLNISEQAVYNYLSQALSLLRKELKPFYLLFVFLFLN